MGVVGWAESFDRIEWLALRRGEVEEAPRRVLEVRRQGKIWAVRLEGITSRTEAEKWIGSEVLARREDLGQAGAGRYWWTDLDGLSVRTQSGELLGSVTGFYATGGVDVLVVAGEQGEKLIPLAPYVKVDLEAGQIVVDPPDGLLDI